MITYSNLFYHRTVLVGVVMLIICTSLNIMILCLKRSKVGPSLEGQNPVQHANPNIGPDGKNKTIISGKNLLFAVAIISFVAIQFVAHILKINISIRLEVSFLIFQIISGNPDPMVESVIPCHVEQHAGHALSQSREPTEALSSESLISASLKFIA